MMNIDRILDTKEKRTCGIHLFILLFMCWMVCMYLQSATILLSLETYDQIYNALSSASLDGCFVTRFVLRSMSMSELEVGTIVMNVFLSLHMVDIIFVLIHIFIWVDQVFQMIRKYFIWILIFFVLQFFMVVVVAFMATNMNSLQGVIDCVRGIGWGMFIIQICLLLLNFILVKKTLYRYREALQYEAIEIQD